MNNKKRKKIQVEIEKKKKRSKSLGPGHTQREGLTQRHAHQEAGITEAVLKAAYIIKMHSRHNKHLKTKLKKKHLAIWSPNIFF